MRTNTLPLIALLLSCGDKDEGPEYSDTYLEATESTCSTCGTVTVPILGFVSNGGVLCEGWARWTDLPTDTGSTLTASHIGFTSTSQTTSPFAQQSYIKRSNSSSFGWDWSLDVWPARPDYGADAVLSTAWAGTSTPYSNYMDSNAGIPPWGGVTRYSVDCSAYACDVDGFVTVMLTGAWEVILYAEEEKSTTVTVDSNGEASYESTSGDPGCSAYAEGGYAGYSGGQGGLEAGLSARHAEYLLVDGWTNDHPGLYVGGSGTSSTGRTTSNNDGYPSATEFESEVSAVPLPGHDERVFTFHDGQIMYAAPLWDVHQGGDKHMFGGSISRIEVLDTGGFDAVAVAWETTAVAPPAADGDADTGMGPPNLGSHTAQHIVRLHPGDAWEPVDGDIDGGAVHRSKVKLWGLYSESVTHSSFPHLALQGRGVGGDELLAWSAERRGRDVYKATLADLGSLGTLLTSFGLVSEDAALYLDIEEFELAADPPSSDVPDVDAILWVRLANGFQWGLNLREDGLGGYSFSSPLPQSASISGSIGRSDGTLWVDDLAFDYLGLELADVFGATATRL